MSFDSAGIEVATAAQVVAALTKLDTLSANIVAATGVVGAGTAAAAARVTHASDDPLVAASGGVRTDVVYNAGVALTPKFAAINASTSGNNTLVAAVTSKKIRVLALWLTSSGIVNAKFQSGAGGTDLTGLGYEVANTGMVLPLSPVGWFETAAGVLLNLNLSAAIPVGGSLVYVEV
jgi:hypothetical protein